MEHIKKDLQKIKHPPLLYIYQSSLPDVDVTMQNQIHNKIGNRSVSDDPAGMEVERDKKEPEKNKKDFSKWSNKEKIIYLTDLPKEQKKSICRIKTKDSEVIGRILKFQKGIVEIASIMSGTNLLMTVDEIEDIEIIGI